MAASIGSVARAGYREWRLVAGLGGRWLGVVAVRLVGGGVEVVVDVRAGEQRQARDAQERHREGCEGYKRRCATSTPVKPRCPRLTSSFSSTAPFP